MKRPKAQKSPPRYVVTREFVGGPGSERNLIEVQLRLIRGTEKPKRAKKGGRK